MEFVRTRCDLASPLLQSNEAFQAKPECTVIKFYLIHSTKSEHTNAPWVLCASAYGIVYVNHFAFLMIPQVRLVKPSLTKYLEM